MTAELMLMQSGSILAPAKLNLTLEVLGRRADGYHALRSVVMPIALCDTLRWQPAQRFSFTCSDPQLAHTDNLVVRAARALGLTDAPLAIHLEKIIPAGSGLGGGSSDAAALLRAAMHGAFGDPRPADWLAIAAGLGSDVPLFLVEAAALIEGRGERVTALGTPPAWWCVLAVPSAAVATAVAYQEIDAANTGQSRPRSQSISLDMVTEVQRGNFTAVESLRQNDFDRVISTLVPEVAQLQMHFARLGHRGLLTGSGSAVYALCATEHAAQRLQQALIAEISPETSLFAVAFARSSTWRPEYAAETKPL